MHGTFDLGEEIGGEKARRGVTYSAMDVVVLWLLEQLAVWAPAVDHAASHGDGDTEDMVKKRVLNS